MSKIIGVIPAVFVTKRRWFREDVIECVQPSKAVTENGTVFDLAPDGSWYECESAIPLEGRKFDITPKTIKRVNQEFANLIRDGEFSHSIERQLLEVDPDLTEGLDYFEMVRKVDQATERNKNRRTTKEDLPKVAREFAEVHSNLFNLDGVGNVTATYDETTDKTKVNYDPPRTKKGEMDDS